MYYRCKDKNKSKVVQQIEANITMKAFTINSMLAFMCQKLIVVTSVKSSMFLKKNPRNGGPNVLNQML